MTNATRPFGRVLVANRGEIACRIMRTARCKGLETVAVYSVADRDSPHVSQAMAREPIGGAQPRDSYLNIDALIAALRRSRADAVHPGYGFLAENADFADAVIAAGAVWIGPSPAAIRAMGNKAQAKILMRNAGVPCIPGYDGARQDDATLAAEAARIGFPVMVKAAAGGGGRGMRLVQEPGLLLGALRSARAEALAAFGSDALILERAMMHARHVEVQVFGDAHGNVVHLGERDCSLQRRHQKLIEESPCPAVSPALREALGAMAVRAAHTIGYVGAGTVECLLAPDGQFYFMEMNTRLQVEHAVTEAVCGVDLVGWQFDVAAGQRLPVKQEMLRLQGHAIEARVTAEDVGAGFMPQTGFVLRWLPAQGARIDHGLAQGTEVSPYYDSMLAKVIAHGATRDEARRKLVLALRQTVLLGVATNQDFLQRCLEHPDFVAGEVDTGFVERALGQGLAADTQPTAGTIARAAIVAARCDPGVPLGGAGSGQLRETRLAPLDSHVRLSCGGQRWEIRLRHPRHAGEHFQADIAPHTNGLLEVTPGTVPFCHVREGRTLFLFDDGRPWRFELDDPRAQGVQAQASGDLRAPLAGRIATVYAKTGVSVRKGDPLVVMEAMKMEHVIGAPFDGVIGTVSVQENEQVRPGAALVQMRAPASA